MTTMKPPIQQLKLTQVFLMCHLILLLCVLLSVEAYLENWVYNFHCVQIFGFGRIQNIIVVKIEEIVKEGRGGGIIKSGPGGGSFSESHVFKVYCSEISTTRGVIVFEAVIDASTCPSQD